MFLCLPDDAAREAASWVEKSRYRRARHVHRAPDGARLVLRLPELSPVQEARLRQAKRIAVPGCHASGFIALVYPLISAGLLCAGCASELLFADRLFRRRQKDDRGIPRAGAKSFLLNAPRQYALGQTHKHLKEMKAVTGLASEPVFCPVVADFYSGMQVTVPLFAGWLKPGAGMEEVKNAYKGLYTGRSSPIRTRRMRAASCPPPHSPVWTA